MILQVEWTWTIAIDLFFGGLGAGTLLASAVIFLINKEKFKKVITFGAWAGPVFLAIGVLFLLMDVGVPSRAIFLYKSFVNANSWAAVGAWLLFSGIIIYGIYALSNTNRVTKRLKFLLHCRTVLSIIIVPLSIGIASYTGLLLSVLFAHPLWNTWLLPVLFAISALLTGVALLYSYTILYKSKIEEGAASLEHSLEVSIVALLILEGIILASYLTIISSSGIEVGAISAQTLTTGALSQLFWIIFIGCGLGLPLLINIILLIRHDLSLKTWGVLPLLGVVGCLAGNFTLRFIVLLAGLPVH